MFTATLRPRPTSDRDIRQSPPTRILVACPDARQPAYEAAAGFASSSRLDRFLTAYYAQPSSLATTLPSALPGSVGPTLARRLARRTHQAVPADRVLSHASYDAALALENRAPSAATRRAVAQWRTRRFDRALARTIKARRPDLVFAFSDVGSEFSLPLCRRLGIPTIVSVVHGDPEEERSLLAQEAARSPEYFPLYLGDGGVDHEQLAWLHARRAADAQLASLLLVPSQHIADRLAQRGVPASRIQIVPYAADTRRFTPRPERPSADDRSCVFLFTGGICQRKGISDLFEAWNQAARPGWTLRLAGALPRNLGPLARDLERPGVEWLGRVGHAEMPGVYAEADVFVFPSLFEGSAVVTYEAMASGLPSITTPESGTLAREGHEGLIVPSANPAALAHAMRRLGDDANLRATLGRQARIRAEAYDWPRYHQSLDHAAELVVQLPPAFA